MADSAVLKEFLVKLAYQIDGNSERKFQRGLEGATSAAVGLGKAVAALSAGVAVAAAKIGENLDELYYQSQRTNAGAQSIKAMGYAVSQLGGSYREALGSIEAFSAKMRQNPGYESMVRQLGVVTRQNGKLRDTVDIMQDLANALKSKPYYVAYQYANALGIDEKTFQAMRSGEYQRRMDEYRKKAAEMGVDLKDAAEKGNKFWTEMRTLEATLGLVGEKLAQSVLPALTQVVKRVDEYLSAHSDQIVDGFNKLGDAATAVGKAFAYIAEKIGPVWEWFDKTSKTLLGQSGLVTALEVLIAVKIAKWIWGIVAALGALNVAAGGAGGGLLGRILGFARFGAIAGVGAALAFGDQKSPERLKEEAEAIDRWKSEGRPNVFKRGWSKLKEKLGFGDNRDKPGDMGGSTFAEKAPKIMRQLMKDFGLTKEQAAGIMGNLGHESGGLKVMQERNPWGGRGGWGWAQWTGPRRRQFEAWAKERGLDPSSDEANYGFLKHELQGSHKGALAAVRRAGSVDEAMMVFENQFERAGIKHYGSRSKWARRAMRAMDEEEKTGGMKMPQAPASTMGHDALMRSINRGPLGAAPIPLSPSSAGDTSVMMNQQTTINVNGNADPAAVAGAVNDAQKGVNGGLVRNLQGAVR